MKPIHGTIRTGNLVSLSQYDNNTIINQCTYTQTGERIFSGHRDVLFEFHLKFWNTASIGIPVRSLL